MWGYPRPPALQRSTRRVRVELAGVTVASTDAPFRVLETSHPPGYYVPAEDVEWQHLTATAGSSFCEWKGTASYWTVTAGGEDVVARAWSYEHPAPRFAELAGCVSFYPSSFACYVDDERVSPQPVAVARSPDGSKQFVVADPEQSIQSRRAQGIDAQAGAQGKR